MDETSPTQLHIDFQTRRPTAIDFGSPIAAQRAACTAVNRERTRGIMEAAQLASPREPIPADVWNVNFARKSKQKEVPLISLELLGIHHDEDGMRSSDFLKPLTSGAEASPYHDEEWNVVYKLFDLRGDGSLGKRISLDKQEDGLFQVQLLPATLKDTLEKLMVLNDAGGHPTEIVGLSPDGLYLIAKQPYAFPYKSYNEDREVATAALRGIVPPFTNLQRQVAIISLDSKGWLISDLHVRNIMRDSEDNPTIIDALIGPVPYEAQRKLTWLHHAVEDAQALRKGLKPTPRLQFGEESEDDSL